MSPASCLPSRCFCLPLCHLSPVYVPWLIPWIAPLHAHMHFIPLCIKSIIHSTPQKTPWNEDRPTWLRHCIHNQAFQKSCSQAETQMKQFVSIHLSDLSIVAHRVPNDINSLVRPTLISAQAPPPLFTKGSLTCPQSPELHDWSMKKWYKIRSPNHSSKLNCIVTSIRGHSSLHACHSWWQRRRSFTPGSTRIWYLPKYLAGPDTVSVRTTFWVQWI